MQIVVSKINKIFKRKKSAQNDDYLENYFTDVN